MLETTLRPLTLADLPAAMELKATANWNQVESDWERLFEFDPQGCFGLFAGHLLAATATALTYGRDLAWIGMVLTHPDFRGRGFAGRLMTACLDYLESLEVTEVKLDATDLGIGIYRRFGFVDQCPIARWARQPAPLTSAPPKLEPAAQPNAELDRRAFGADRTPVLQSLQRTSATLNARDGYAMARSGSHAAYLGPCVATNPQTAQALIANLLEPLAAGPVNWDLFPGHPAAAIAQSLGFAQVRTLTRMTKVLRPGATRIQPDNSLVYAIAGFELG